MTGRLVQQTALTNSDRDAMYSLLGAHFEGVSRAGFETDLIGKNWVVLAEHAGELFGFSTIQAYQTEVEGERLSVVYSGDTIVAPAAWGSAAFPRAWINAVYELNRQTPDERLIWLLLTSGFRTYRFLPVFWNEFYPRAERPTPPAWHRLIDTLASRQFRDRYDRATGLVRFQRPQRLRGHLREVPPERAVDPHVAFFLARNPGHADGDELVCATDLRPENLSRAGRRVVYGSAR